MTLAELIFDETRPGMLSQRSSWDLVNDVHCTNPPKWGIIRGTLLSNAPTLASWCDY